mgnify:CR=1 FL=1
MVTGSKTATSEVLAAIVKEYGLFEIDIDSFFFSHSLNRRMENLNKVKKKRRIAGLKSGEARKAIVPETNQNEPKATIGSKNEPNEHETVTVNDTDTVNGTVTDTDILLEKETKENLKKVSISKNEIFGKEVLESQSWLETISMQNKITPEEIPKWIDDFNKKLISELDNKISKKEYASHFSRWLPGEIIKSKQNGKQQSQFNSPTKTAYKFDAARIIETNTRQT